MLNDLGFSFVVNRPGFRSKNRATTRPTPCNHRKNHANRSIAIVMPIFLSLLWYLSCKQLKTMPTLVLKLQKPFGPPLASLASFVPCSFRPPCIPFLLEIKWYVLCIVCNRRASSSITAPADRDDGMILASPATAVPFRPCWNHRWHAL